MYVGVLAGRLRRGTDTQQYSLNLVSFVPSGGGPAGVFKSQTGKRLRRG